MDRGILKQVAKDCESSHPETGYRRHEPTLGNSLTSSVLPFFLFLNKNLGFLSEHFWDVFELASVLASRLQIAYHGVEGGKPI